MWFLLLLVSLAKSQELTRNCECIPSFLCKNVTTVLGNGIIDVRMIEDECPHSLDVCCPIGDSLPTPQVRNIPRKLTSQCGMRNPDGVAFRIQGGNDVDSQFGEFPWMVAIFQIPSTVPVYICGGSLIHPKVVLTAAHCIVNTKGKVMVRAGEWDTQTTNELLQHEDIAVNGHEIHKMFKRENLQYDIGLLFLEKEFQLAQHINVVCLPRAESVLSSKCWATGWGKDKFGSETYQNIMKKIDVPMVERSQCETALRSTRLGDSFNLERTFVCAGGERGKDACTGDGGGPLVCPVSGYDNKYQQVGIVSWGIGCGTAGVPGVYSDVAYMRKWVDSVMKKKDFDISGYEF